MQKRSGNMTGCSYVQTALRNLAWLIELLTSECLQGGTKIVITQQEFREFKAQRTQAVEDSFGCYVHIKNLPQYATERDVYKMVREFALATPRYALISTYPTDICAGDLYYHGV